MTALPHRGSLSSYRYDSRPEPCVDSERALRLVSRAPEQLPRPCPQGAVYWRRRFMALVCATLLLVGTWRVADWTLGLLSSDSRSDSPSVHVIPERAAAVSWTVRPGDTLWSIATAVAPAGSDVRPLVAKLSKRLGNRPLQAGETIVL